MTLKLSRRRLLQLTGGATAAGGAVAAVLPAAACMAPQVPPHHQQGAPAGPEPNIEIAKGWWPPQRQVWTPLGWKGHLFRFNVFYNGTVVCEPGAVLAGPKPNVVPYQGKNFQLTVLMPARTGGFAQLAKEDYFLYKDDLGVRQQGYVVDDETPHLWTEFRRQEGLVLRESVFVHVKDGRPVQTAIEPTYAWIRFTVEHVDDRIAPADFTFMLRLSKATYKISGSFDQQNGVPIVVRPSAAKLDGPLRTDRIWNSEGRPLTAPVYDHNGNVRMIVGTPAKGRITLAENTAHPGVFDLQLGLPVKVGTHIDVMVPMLPEPKAAALAEWNLGRDGALAQCEAYWSAPKEPSAITIRTPESYVDQFFRRSPQLAQIVAEKSADTSLFTFLTGSYAYDLLWSTPTSMVSHMFLDLLGYHDVVEQHIEIYKQSQGTRIPPGRVFAGGSYPGYLSTPASLQALDWLSDHGAILEILSVHALLTDRKAFIDRWLEPIVKACDHIKQVCAMTNHNGVKGLVPPGWATDEVIDTQGILSQAWTYKGLRSAIRLLRRVGHPRADEFATFADGFQRTYAAALADVAATSPTWTDKDGNKHPVLPASFTGERGQFAELVMFDAGALASVWAGLLPASDYLMRTYLDFYRVGPNTRLFDPVHHNAFDRPVLDHEQSSSEPYFSWNMFHTWQLGDRARFVEGMYGLLVGAISPDTYISCEHRDAIYGNMFVQPLIVWSVRHAVIDDDLADDELHLLRICPQAWISTSTQTAFERVPTVYGPVSLRFQQNGHTLAIDFSARWHHRPARIVVHTPPVPGLRGLTLNGRRFRSCDRIVLQGASI